VSLVNENILKKVAESQQRHYRSCYEKHGATLAGASWGEESRTSVRWKLSYEVFKLDPAGVLDNPIVLDVGCSFGGMYSFGKSLGLNMQYTGIDPVEESIVEARKNHKRAKFYCKNITFDNIDGMFDYVVSCGIFAVKGSVSHRDMHLYWKETTRRMFDKCTRGMSFNLFSSRVNKFDENSYYLSPVEALAFCMEELSDKVVLHHATSLYDFFIYVYK